ncbi:MAG: phosphotransferase family protein [Geminicoccaceae bacterium]
MASSDHRRFIRICQGLLRTKIKRTEFPGGKSRDACRLLLEDGRVAFGTRRDSPRLAALEARVLKKLSAGGAPVPKVLAFNGLILIQEDLGRQRLSEAIDQASATEVQTLLAEALNSLAKVHDAAESAGLDENLPLIGRDEPWLLGLLNQPDVISKRLGLKPPELDREAIMDQIRIRNPRLIKWDARCGNAILRDDGTIAWFDWEHCGRRNRLDDLVWLLGDEFTPDLPDVEEALLQANLKEFADDLSIDQARSYVAEFGTFHSCVRLELILENKDDDEWWDWAYCLERDKVGVTLEGAQRLCSRGARWAEWSPLTRPLVLWFNEVAEHLVELNRTEERGAA